MADQPKKHLTPEEQDALFSPTNLDKDGVAVFRISRGSKTPKPVGGVSKAWKWNAKGEPSAPFYSGAMLMVAILYDADGDSRRANDVRAGLLEKTLGEMGMRQDAEGYFVGLAPNDDFIKTLRDFYTGDTSAVRECLRCIYTTDEDDIPLTAMQELILSQKPGKPLPRVSSHEEAAKLLDEIAEKEAEKRAEAKDKEAEAAKLREEAVSSNGVLAE